MHDQCSLPYWAWSILSVRPTLWLAHTSLPYWQHCFSCMAVRHYLSCKVMLLMPPDSNGLASICCVNRWSTACSQTPFNKKIRLEQEMLLCDWSPWQPMVPYWALSVIIKLLLSHVLECMPWWVECMLAKNGWTPAFSVLLLLFGRDQTVAPFYLACQARLQC